MDLLIPGSVLILGFRFRFTILFHKNKEIKRMLSKKMAFSLTSLITILVLALIAVPVKAADDFDAGFSVANMTYGTDIVVTVTFKEAVTLAGVAAGEITVHVEDMNGVLTAITVPTSTDGTVAAAAADTTSEIMQKDINTAVAGTQVDGKSYVFTIAAASTDMNDRKIHLYIPAGVARRTPNEEKTSKEGAKTIDLIGPAATNISRPNVVSIQRLRPGSQTVVAAFQEAEVTGAFDVRIVLTEKGHKPGKGDAINAGDIKVDGGTASGWTVGVPFARVGGTLSATPTNAERASTISPHPLEGMYWHDNTGGLAGVPRPTHADADTAAAANDLVPLPTGTDNMYYQYRVTITPHRRADMVKVSVKEFHDNEKPFPNVYKPFNVDNKANGREQLRLKVNIPKFNLGDGLRVYLPHSEGAKITYAGGKAGHYILTRDKGGSSIRHFHEKDEENKAQKQTPAQLLYNVRASGDLPNLETFLANHGTIHLVSYSGAAAGSAYISEVMWGTDASQDPVSKSNWIEIRNGTSAAIDVKEKMWALWFYEAHETPAAAYPAGSAYEGPTGQAGTIVDVIGTKASDTGLSWSIAGKGQSGRSNIDTARVEHQVLSPTTPLISMYRMMNADSTLSNGTLAASWMQTPGPSVNLAIGRENAIVATPGAAPFDTPDTAKAAADAEKAKADAAAAAAAAAAAKTASTGTIPSDGQIYISEIMFAGGGTLPQWIEISNGSRTEEVNLSGWTLSVVNSAADADVSVGAAATFTIPAGTKIAASGQSDMPSTILVVTEKGRTNLTGRKAAGQVVVLDAPGSSTEVQLILAGVTTRKYTLLSDMAFMLTLAPPVPAATKAPAGETAAAKATRMAAEARAAANRKMATDMVGNLSSGGSAAWALPMNEDGSRSSIIRRHIQVARGPAAPEDGTMEANWVLASDTSFAQVTHIRAASFYGAANDVGTPGFRPGGALPVELSHFRPARDKATGAVVITWATQSELNNAGFFIKRSQQRDGQFTVINPTLIPGAGTTSEKQFYTYTDTTAQPNIVYYYQIEDVSLDGNRQTLTRGIRLKGHIGAAGKATTLWGELKTSHE